MSVTSVNGQTGVATVDLQNAFDAGAGTLSLNASNLTITDTSSGSQDGVIINTDSTGCALKLTKNGQGSLLSISNPDYTNPKPLISVYNGGGYTPTIGTPDASVGEFVGPIILKAGNKDGDEEGARGGSIALMAGSCTSNQGGGVFIYSGRSDAEGKRSGEINFLGASSTIEGGPIFLDAGSGESGGIGGAVKISSGSAADNVGGNLEIFSGYGNIGGNISIKSGNGNNVTGGVGGSLEIASGDGPASGDIAIKVGTGDPGTLGVGGKVEISAGEAYTAGDLIIKSGEGAGNGSVGGDVEIASGSGDTAGNIFIKSGDGAVNGGGSIEIASGSGATVHGSIIIKSEGDLTFKSPHIDRSAYSNPGYVREKYLHSITLTGSSTAVASQLTFDSAEFDSVIIAYRIKENTTDVCRVGTMMVATNGTNVSLIDTYTETENAGVTWSAALSGSEVRISYTATANNKVMHADVKSFLT